MAPSMSAIGPLSTNAINRRLQGVLMLLIAWDIIALVAEFSFGSALFKVEGDAVSGFLAARGSFSGLALVPLVVYAYAFVRGPLRHRGALWVGMIEQGAAVLFGVYHAAAGELSGSSVAVTLVVSLGLLVLLVLTLPRGQFAT
jgi:hypothetical protein